MIKATYKTLNNQSNKIYNFKGYIEGNEMMNGDVNVIVTDGFTGNVALKTAEGTANFITSELKNAMTGNLFGKIASIINLKNINKFKKRLDPRLYNGGIFLGLDSPVVKSHGSTDYIGFANSLGMCEKIVLGNLIDKIKQNID
jgi:glycerol-3-phosphate acyltransferase PlsX